MALLPLKIPPGMKRTGTKYAAYGRWYAGNFVRFVKDIVRPIGGWAYQSADSGGSGTPTIIDLVGTPRGAIGWEVAGGRGWQVYGTAGASNVYAYSLGSLWNISPISTWADTFTYSNDTDLASVGYTAVAGTSEVYGNKAYAIWGGPWQYSQGIPNTTERLAIGTDVYEIYVDVTRAAIGSGAGIIYLCENTTTPYGCLLTLENTDASNMRLYYQRYSSAGFPDQEVVVTGLAIADGESKRIGITLDMSTGVQTPWIEDAGGGNRTTYAAVGYTGTEHTSSGRLRVGVLFVGAGDVSNGGYALDNLSVSEVSLTASNVDTSYGTGSGATYYGQGDYGDGPYGSGNPVGSVTLADVWHLDNFGNLLVATQVPSNDSLYWWDPATPTTKMALISSISGATGVPIDVAGLVVTPERFLVALGAGGNARNVAWSDRENMHIFTSLATNEAGDIDLEGRGKIIAGRRGRAETLIWTDADLFSMRYQGGVYVYGFEKRGTHCGLVAPGAVAEINGEHIWMGMRGFFRYDGYVRDIECEVEDYVFDDMNRDQRIKVHCLVNHEFDEITWFYPSSSSTEIDRYVTWNYVEEHWTLGTLSRTAAVSATTTNLKPIMLDSTGAVYLHESGWDHSIGQGGSNVTPYIESGPVEIGNGDHTLHVYKVVPDEANLGDVQASLYVSFQPMDSETEIGPFTATSNQDARAHGRWARLKLSEVNADDWRVGKFRLDVKKGGKR